MEQEKDLKELGAALALLEHKVGPSKQKSTRQQPHCNDHHISQSKQVSSKHEFDSRQASSKRGFQCASSRRTACMLEC